MNKAKHLLLEIRKTLSLDGKGVRCSANYTQLTDWMGRVDGLGTKKKKQSVK